MRFLADANVGKDIAHYLRDRGDDVLWMTELEPGVDNQTIIRRALRERRIVLTYDLDFGELVYQDEERHSGVVLIRARLEAVTEHLRLLKKLLAQHTEEELTTHFWSLDERILM